MELRVVRENAERTSFELAEVKCELAAEMKLRLKAEDALTRAAYNYNLAGGSPQLGSPSEREHQREMELRVQEMETELESMRSNNESVLNAMQATSEMAIIEPEKLIAQLQRKCLETAMRQLRCSSLST